MIHISSKDRAGEVGFLLTSLMAQTYKDWDLVILDDGSKDPLQGFYFIQYLVNRIKYEGHDVNVLRNNEASGVSMARQKLVDWHLANSKCEYILRLDDDIILQPDYIEQLAKGIDAGYDLMSGITTPMNPPNTVRNIKNVEPIIGYCGLNKDGELIANFDDCGFMYNENKILLSPHFRSCALYTRKIHEAGVDYHSRLSRNGFREEQIFSFKAILAGFKLGVNTAAVNFHLMTPSGGERDTMNMTQFNQQQFEETVKMMFQDHGDFLATYYKKHGVVPKQYTDLELMHPFNLVSKKKVVNLLDYG